MDISARYRLGLWAILVLVILNIGLLGLFWYEHFNRPPQTPRDRAKPEERFVRELQLDQQQTDSAQILRREHLERSDSIRTRIVQLGIEMTNELFAPVPDSARIRQLSEDIGHFQAEFERQVCGYFLEVKSLLRHDQHERFRQLILDALEKKRPEFHDADAKHQQFPEDQELDNRDDRRPLPPSDRTPPPDDRRPPLRDNHRPPPQDDDRRPSRH